VITSCLVPVVTGGTDAWFNAIVELAVPLSVNEHVGKSFTVVSKDWGDGATLQPRVTFPLKVVEVTVMGRLPGCPALTVMVSFDAGGTVKLGRGARVKLVALTFIVVADDVVEAA
jgi:hypothetical protein